MNNRESTSETNAQSAVESAALLGIVDEKGKPLEIGMRVGCRNKGQSVSWSRRGLTLTGYEPGTDEPYITNAGRFALAIKDHQPDREDWITKHVTA